MAMLRTLALWLTLTILLSGNVTAQCTCNSCSNVAGEGCRDIGPWDRDFYDCCHDSLSADRVYDPFCCRYPYISVVGGATFVENFHRQIELPPAMSGVIETQGPSLLDGYAFGGAFGFRVHPQLRLEMEYTYRDNEVGDWFTGIEDNGLLTSLTAADASGSVNTHSLMFNSLYDLTTPQIGRLNLYGGGGIGVLYVDSTITLPAETYEVADSAFAWQLVGGVSLPVRQNVELFAEYRYLGADKLNVDDANTSLPFGDFDYDSHNVFLGIRLYR
jgi:opacity protein-like surface antigen